jgi:hypothetical protein
MLTKLLIAGGLVVTVAIHSAGFSATFHAVMR